MKNRVKELRKNAGMTQQELAGLVFGTTVEDLYCLRENLEEEEKRYEAF